MSRWLWYLLTNSELELRFSLFCWVHQNLAHWMGKRNYNTCFLIKLQILTWICWIAFLYPCLQISFSLFPVALCIEQIFHTPVREFLSHFSRQRYALNNAFKPLSANFFITSPDNVIHWTTFLYPYLPISLSLLTTALCMAIDLREFYYYSYGGDSFI